MKTNNQMGGRLLLCLVTWLAAQSRQPLPAQPFVEFPTPNVASLHRGGSGWADFNHDNFLDFLTTGVDQSGRVRTRLYLNVGGNGFREAATDLVALQRTPGWMCSSPASTKPVCP